MPAPYIEPFTYLGVPWQGWSSTPDAPSFDVGEGTLAVVTEAVQTMIVSKANKELDNLGVTAVNVDILSEDGTQDIGSVSLPFAEVHGTKVLTNDITGTDDVVMTFGTGKTLKLATPVWDDLRVPGLATRLGANAPDLEVFQDTLYLNAFAGTGTVEQAYFAVQVPHSYKEGTDLEAHIHWSHKIAEPSADGGVVWKLDYSWVNIDGTFPTVGTIVMSEIWTDTPPPQFAHVMTEGATELDGTGKTVSSMIVGRLYRDNAAVTDTFEEDALLLEFDFHFQIDTLGSRTEDAK